MHIPVDAWMENQQLQSECKRPNARASLVKKIGRASCETTRGLVLEEQL